MTRSSKRKRTPVRFVADDQAGLWKKGELAQEIGLESPGANVPVWLIRTQKGEVLAIESPYERGLIEKVEL